MGDEFFEHDTQTPSEKDVAEAFGSRFLGVVDVGDKKIRTKICGKKEEVEDRKTGKLKKKIVVFFESIDKGLILNGVNRETLEIAFGKKPADWLNAIVGIFVDPNVMFGGLKKGGVRLRLRVLTPAAAEADIEARTGRRPPASDWAEEGDPGPDPADFEPAD